MEEEIKEQLIKSVDSIKNKIRMIQNEEDSTTLKLRKMFKPITDPLGTLINVNRNVNPILDNFKSFHGNNTIGDLNCSIESEKSWCKADSNTDSEYYDDTVDISHNSENNSNLVQSLNDTLVSLKKEDLIDIYDNMSIPFGIHSNNNILTMGNSPVTISVSNKTSNKDEKKYVITINDKNYELTSGLKQLLMRNKPDLSLITDMDKKIYKDILIDTSAHKRDFNPKGQIRGDKGLKYREIIKPMFSQITDANQHYSEQLMKSKIGGSLPKLKQYKKNTDYVYWDDPNELIERLKLLIASKSAGNSNHDNEIVSIIEELKEAGIIKE